MTDLLERDVELGAIRAGLDAAQAGDGCCVMLELMATRSGRALYESFGFGPVEETEDAWPLPTGRSS